MVDMLSATCESAWAETLEQLRTEERIGRRGMDESQLVYEDEGWEELYQLEHEGGKVLHQPGYDWNEALKRIHEYERAYYEDAIPLCKKKLWMAEQMVAHDVFVLNHCPFFSQRYLLKIKEDLGYWRHEMWSLRRWLVSLLTGYGKTSQETT